MNIEPLSQNQALMAIVISVLLLTSLVIILSIVVFSHHVVSDRSRKKNRERFERAAIALAPHIVSEANGLEPAVAEARHQFGDRAVSLVLRRARHDVRGEAGERISAVLKQMGAIDQLIEEAKSRREWKRLGAIRGLGECGGEQARAVLIEAAANDPVGEVRRAARDGLLSDGSLDAIHAAIASFLIDLPRRAGWRRSFYARLASVESNELLSLITSGQLSEGEEKLALEALGDAGTKEALELAIRRSTAEDGELRATAIRVIGKLGSDAEMELILGALTDPEWYVRTAAARSVETMFVSRNLTNTQPSTYESICMTVGERLTDASWWVRANAARALSRGGRAGADVLITAAEGPDRYARDAALAAIAMVDVDAGVRERVLRLVERLRLEAAAPKQAPPATLQAQGAVS